MALGFAASLVAAGFAATVLCACGVLGVAAWLVAGVESAAKAGTWLKSPKLLVAASSPAARTPLSLFMVILGSKMNSPVLSPGMTAAIRIPTGEAERYFRYLALQDDGGEIKEMSCAGRQYSAIMPRLLLRCLAHACGKVRPADEIRQRYVLIEERAIEHSAPGAMALRDARGFIEAVFIVHPAQLDCARALPHDRNRAGATEEAGRQHHAHGKSDQSSPRHPSLQRPDPRERCRREINGKTAFVGYGMRPGADNPVRSEIHAPAPRDPAQHAEFKRRLHETEADPVLARQYLINLSMIASLRRTEELG